MVVGAGLVTLAPRHPGGFSMLFKMENSPTASAINGMVFVTLSVLDAPDDTGSLRIQLSPGRAAELKVALESAIITANVQRRRS